MRYLFVLLLGIMSITLQGQNQQLPPSIRVSYFGSFLVRPGISIGTEIPLRTWGNEASTEAQPKIASISKKILFVPQLALYSWPGNYTNLFLNTNWTYHRQKQGKNNYSAMGLGLGLLRESTLQSFTLNLGSGDVTDTDRAHQLYFLPTIHYELGGKLSNRLTWFTKYAVGIKLAPNANSSTQLFVEIGTKFHFKSNPQK